MSLYWKCQAAGWSVYALLAAGIPTLYGGMRWTVLLRAVIGVALGLALTEQLRRFMIRREWLRLPTHQLAPRVATASVVVAAIMVAILLPLLLINLSGRVRAGPLTTIYSIHVIFILGWMLLYIGYHYVHRIAMVESDRWRLQAAMRETELRALRAQLNPHFLFNSLNSLRGLITEDPVRAQEAVTALAALLRHTLRMSKVQTTTVETEVEAAQHYLALEALRFERRLSYDFHVQRSVLQHRIPPMLIQTLVENAVKHGIATLPGGGAVSVSVHESAGALQVVVRNTGTLRPDRPEGGFGLANARERLHLLAGEPVTLKLYQSAADEVTCHVAVPSGPFSHAPPTQPGASV
jgi:two-component system LytT family sensor kinase